MSVDNANSKIMVDVLVNGSSITYEYNELAPGMMFNPLITYLQPIPNSPNQAMILFENPHHLGPLPDKMDKLKSEHVFYTYEAPERMKANRDAFINELKARQAGIVTPSMAEAQNVNFRSAGKRRK